MRKLCLLLVFVPVVSFAQLDRIRTNMTEKEFVAAFPEAKRDYEAEAVWVSDSTLLKGIHGESAWRIFKDTVSGYRFSSDMRQGPSANFPKYDSAGVHAMKLALDKIRKEIELSEGKPTLLQDLPLTERRPMQANVVYIAEWTFLDKSTIRLMLRHDGDRIRINAQALADAPKSVGYEISISIEHRSLYTRTNFSIAKSSNEFFVKYPQLKARVPGINNRYYSIEDKLTSPDALWSFVFSGGSLIVMEYSAYGGTEYGAATDEAAYASLKRKADQLLLEGKKSFGVADSLSNSLSTQYKPHERRLTYHEQPLYCEWSTQDGQVLLEMTEVGGGKNPATVFNLRVHFERDL